jgi:hypothetical protein
MNINYLEKPKEALGWTFGWTRGKSSDLSLFFVVVAQQTYQNRKWSVLIHRIHEPPPLWSIQECGESQFHISLLSNLLGCNIIKWNIKGSLLSQG